MATVEYLSQPLLYQNNKSIITYDGNYDGTQIFEFQLQEIDKGSLQDSAIDVFQFFEVGFPEVDRGSFINTITGTDSTAYSYTQYFKMRGWYATNEEYETWTSANLPNLNPLSGNVLTDIVIVSIWFA